MLFFQVTDCNRYDCTCACNSTASGNNEDWNESGKRPGEPIEVAQAIAFLASDDS